MRNGMFLLVASLCLVPGSLWSAGERLIPEKPKTQCLKIAFNGETLSAYYLLIDARTTGEQEADSARGALNGSVLVFFQGHGQRPGDAYKFTSKLAAGSAAGIVVVPVVDTPYGTDAAWRGDRGKDVVLMAIVRHVLAGLGLTVDGYQPLTDMPVAVDGKDLSEVEKAIPVKLAAVGWSHGGIVARRMAHAYPQSFVGLGQVCPAGYKHWGCTGALIGRFTWEGMHISTLVFRGHAIDTLGCGWGLTRGITGDFCRSVPKAVVDLQPSKLGRSWRDVRDCCLYCDDTNLPLTSINNIVVIFGRDDFCIRHADYGLHGPDTVSDADAAEFWQTYYPGAQASGAKLDVRIMPGMHVGPVTESESYARTILTGMDEGVPSPAPAGDTKP